MASLFIFVLVSVFDLIAFALAVVAEHRSNTTRIVNEANSSYCESGSNTAPGLGVGSLLFLMLSQVIVMVVTRCLCFGQTLKPSRSRVWAITLFITCWVCFVIAELCLLVGSVMNARRMSYVAGLDDDLLSCKMARERGRVFGAGAAFIVLTGIVSELFYEFYSRAYDYQPSYSIDPGIRMGNL